MPRVVKTESKNTVGALRLRSLSEVCRLLRAVSDESKLLRVLGGRGRLDRYAAVSHSFLPFPSSVLNKGEADHPRHIHPKQTWNFLRREADTTVGSLTVLDGVAADNSRDD